jgi:hypothetical protein
MSNPQGVAENEGGCVMRRTKLVVAVLAMLVVMVGSAVPAMAQDLFGNEQINFNNQGDDPGQDDYYNKLVTAH